MPPPKAGERREKKNGAKFCSALPYSPKGREGREAGDGDDDATRKWKTRRPNWSPYLSPLSSPPIRILQNGGSTKERAAMIYKQTRAINSCGGRWKKRKEGGGWIPGGEVKMESAEGTRKGVFRNGRSAKTGEGRGKPFVHERPPQSGRKGQEQKKGKRAVRTILSRLWASSRPLRYVYSMYVLCCRDTGTSAPACALSV